MGLIFYNFNPLELSSLSMPYILKVILPSSVVPNFSCPKTIGLSRKKLHDQKKEKIYPTLLQNFMKNM